MNDLQITGEDIEGRASLRDTLNNLKGFQGKLEKKTGEVWTDERQYKSKGMKGVWEGRRQAV